MHEKKHPFLIMAGGTGGHVMPAIAVAEKLHKLGVDVHWMGTPLGIESSLVPKHNIPISYVTIQGIRGKGTFSKFLAPFRIFRAFIQSIRIMRRVRPKAVLSMGGYVAGPGGLAAWFLKIPLVLHEQNSIPGLTNRLLAPFSKKILVAFPDTFQSSKVIVTGNPVREAILSVHTQRVGHQDKVLRILVIGGSLGARFLNQTVPVAIQLLQDNTAIEVWHQTGKQDYHETKSLYHDFKHVRLDPFIEDMAKAYIWADLVICRAGALTVSELAAAGVPSILVPFPYAVDDHQRYNGLYLEKANAAILLSQNSLDPSKLSKVLKELSENKQKLKKMGHQSLSKAFPKASDLVAQHCVEVYGGSSIQ